MHERRPSPGGKNRSRRAPARLRLRPADWFFPRRLLRYARCEGGGAPGLRQGDGAVSRVFARPWQRPFHAASRDALPRSQARRPLVSARAALDRGLGGRQGAQGRARGDARGRAPVGAAARAQAPRARSALSVAGIGARPDPGKSVAIIGGGPAGLMAAEAASNAGARVDVYDAMPSVGRKFLMAGKGGLNLTHSEPSESFLSRYGARRACVEPLLAGFAPQALRAWARGLGVETFVGSSGRVFPSGMKAAPLLRAWLHRLRAAGVHFHLRHRWCGWEEDRALRFSTPQGARAVRAGALVLALGGGSWARLGSTGAWVPLLAARGVRVEPLRPANRGFDFEIGRAHVRTPGTLA